MNDQWNKGHNYWDNAFNPVVGCRPVSEGCEHCYAKKMWLRFNPDSDFKPTPTKTKPPKSGIVFVGNMTDLFGEWNTDKQIIDWLGSLEHYTARNMILTKRATRLRDLLNRVEFYERAFPVGKSFRDKYWFGVTCENQQRADERIPELLKTNVSKKWMSLEPLMGPIDLSPYLVCDPYYAVECKHCGWIGSSEYCPGFEDSYTCPGCYYGEPEDIGDTLIDWVVVGAESGPDRRECKLEWIESIVEQCQTVNVPVFVKQIHMDGKLVTNINQFPEHLQIRQMPWNTETEVNA